MTHTKKHTILGSCLALALGVSLATTTRAEPPAKTSGAADRKKVSLTVYNSNVGLIREVRELKQLGSGQSTLQFSDVATTIRPETVLIKTGAGLRVLEQNYRYDLLTPDTLLRKNVGKALRLYRYHEATGKEEPVDATLLSMADRPVLQIGSEVTFDYPGRFAFREVPPELVARPTLQWLVASPTAKPTVEVSYLAGGLNWSADYVLVTNADDSKADLTGWVTLNNVSGLSVENAELQLVAGDVNSVQPQMAPLSVSMKSGSYAEAAPAPAFSEQSLFEYHLYTLERPTSIRDQEQKQVQLLEGSGIALRKKLIVAGGQEYWYRGPIGEQLQNEQVDVYLEFENDKKSDLGIPLPAGVLRVYKADKKGQKQFLGEDRIKHTPRDEKVRVKVGKAFDVLATRKQTEFLMHSNCSTESAWEIEVRNHKDEQATVELREPLSGDWQLISSNLPSQKEDAQTLVFSVDVPKNGKTKLVYRVRTRFC